MQIGEKIEYIQNNSGEVTKFTIYRKGEKNFHAFIDDVQVGSAHSAKALLQRFYNLMQNDIRFDLNDFKEV